MASREELLQSIKPKMKLNKVFFLRIYGYEISFPGFSDEAIKALNNAGCSRARDYYNKIVSEYEKRYDEEMKKVAAWYRKECEKEWQARQKKRGEVRRKREQEDLRKMSDSDLIMLLENLIGVT